MLNNTRRGHNTINMPARAPHITLFDITSSPLMYLSLYLNRDNLVVLRFHVIMAPNNAPAVSKYKKDINNIRISFFT
jgi:hypothetical protein